MPRPFRPASRAEALGGTLADIRQAASEDRAFLFGLATIVADLLKPAEAKPAASDADDVRSAWRTAQTRNLHHA